MIIFVFTGLSAYDRSSYTTPNYQYNHRQSLRVDIDGDFDEDNGRRRMFTTPSARTPSQRKGRFSPSDTSISTSPKHYMSPTMSVESRVLSRMEEDPAYARLSQQRQQQQQKKKKAGQALKSPAGKHSASPRTPIAANSPSSHPKPPVQQVLHNDLVVELQKRLQEALLSVNPDIDPSEIRRHQRYVFGV